MLIYFKLKNTQTTPTESVFFFATSVASRDLFRANIIFFYPKQP